MSTQQARMVVHTYIFPYFLYCPLIWMFCRKKENNLINKVHKRALKAIYNDSSSSFEGLLLLDNNTSFHNRHLQLLMLEVFKSLFGTHFQINTRLLAISQLLKASLKHGTGTVSLFYLCLNDRDWLIDWLITWLIDHVVEVRKRLIRRLAVQKIKLMSLR